MIVMVIIIMIMSIIIIIIMMKSSSEDPLQHPLMFPSLPCQFPPVTPSHAQPDLNKLMMKVMIIIMIMMMYPSNFPLSTLGFLQYVFSLESNMLDSAVLFGDFL